MAKEKPKSDNKKITPKFSSKSCAPSRKQEDQKKSVIREMDGRIVEKAKVTPPLSVPPKKKK